MEFEEYSIVLLSVRENAPQLDQKADTALRDAHLAHIARLHEAGQVLAAGPFPGATMPGPNALCLLAVAPEEARKLEEHDPMVLAGVYSFEVFPWMVPKGAMHFAPASFPHSLAEALSGNPQQSGP